jgi:hypothetical protein
VDWLAVERADFVDGLTARIGEFAQDVFLAANFRFTDFLEDELASAKYDFLA